MFSVFRGASAGPGSSGPSPIQTGPERRVDPQRLSGQLEGDSAESTIQPHPDTAAFHQTAPKPGEELP